MADAGQNKSHSLCLRNYPMSDDTSAANEHSPLKKLAEWEDDVISRYPEPGEKHKAREEYRNYAEPPRSTVREFYRVNHTCQTYEFVQQKKKQFLSLDRKEMSTWDAMEYLNTLVDDSDPDTDLSQLQHLLQTAEAIRADGHPDWFVLVGLIHDLGKVLCLFGEPQWAVVGDTFPVGCAYSDNVVYPEFFQHNPDYRNPVYQTKLGVYEEGCGLDKVHLSWGHDEYIYNVVKGCLPEEGLYMLRYHSFYAAHREGAYEYLMNDHDKKMFEWVRRFNPYDLYSKSPVAPDPVALRPYYEDLIAKYLPAKLRL
jgi:inositol oxygenase